MLAADANRGWSVERAIELAPSFAEYNLAWLEEPIRADRPWQEWQLLRKNVRTPLAAGENIASRAGFTQALGDGVLSAVQPDIAKRGGLSVCAGIARDIIGSGKTFYPHYLGGGIGPLASAHLLAGVGGDGLLEVDANDNPLRDRFSGAVAKICHGTITLAEAPGLGIGRHWRSSSASAFLKPVRSRTNLTIITRAQVSKVTFRAKVATGVEWIKDRQVHSTVGRPRSDSLGRRAAIAADPAVVRSRTCEPAVLARHGRGCQCA
jgi:choline dehydrogenase-like flavoprotein